MCNCNIKFNFRQNAGNTEIQAVCCGCKGPWSVMSSGGGGGAFLPLAGGSMASGAVVNFFGGGTLQSTISVNGWQYQDSSVGGAVNIGFDTLSSVSNNVIISPISGRILVNDGVQEINADATYEPGKTAMLVNDSGGNVKVTLLRFPLNLYPIGTIYRVKKMGAAPNTVEIAPNSGSIEGVGSIFLTVQNESATIVRSGNSTWNIV
jgi:hypothetical protein